MLSKLLRVCLRCRSGYILKSVSKGNLELPKLSNTVKVSALPSAGNTERRWYSNLLQVVHSWHHHTLFPWQLCNIHIPRLPTVLLLIVTEVSPQYCKLSCSQIMCWNNKTLLLFPNSTENKLGKTDHAVPCGSWSHTVRHLWRFKRAHF